MIVRAILILIFCLSSLNPLVAIQRFPPITPNATGMLQVDECHQIYWEESGNPAGTPILFLHGGPGSGADESCRTFFDPDFYRIIVFDQRGAGKSLPQGCLTNNTTWDLVEDINKLRQFLSIDRCLLFGGSWGSTLALTYAIKYPEHVSGLILRGIFLCRQAEFDWFYKKGGASVLSPKAWKIFTNCIPKEKRKDLIAAYHDLLHSDSHSVRIKAVAAWVLWGVANLQSTPIPDDRLEQLLNSTYRDADQNMISVRIENHYFLNRGFFRSDNWILENIHRIRNIPGVIVQGECDQICPWKNAQELHLKWPASTFILVPNAGHSSSEPGILKALIEATESFKTKSL